MTEAVTTAGRVAGRSLDIGGGRTIASFLGIAYGASTGGINRFKPPQPVEPWPGIRAASSHGPSAPQEVIEQTQMLELFGGCAEPSMSEDCLYLNVWTPGVDAGTRPVFVYFHGGGHTMGSGSWPAYDGTAMATRDVVVVTVNHRLGVMAYLHLGHLLGDEYAASGACGMLDCVASLEWVRDNITAFGGDPGNVTICGESGGGSKVATLLAMPAADGLYHRAAIMSGWFDLRGASVEAASAVTDKVLAHVGLTADTARELLSMPTEQLVAASSALGGLVSGLAPMVDGRHITMQPIDAVRNGRSPAVPLLIGSTRDEYSMFLKFAVMGIGGADVDAATSYLRSTFGPDVDAVIERYAANRAGTDRVVSDYDVLEAVATDGHVRMPAITMAEAKLAASGEV